ncbi:hypothetical protein NDU88_001574 [Pleurodeles waltl]|uniref:Uncharacterized protein n=1 Tax=Pleurodeles waltl TaxID=8319 RepID=A0AAV7NBJ3_PLEWA|nr:hypothetical protein NDU88_001574 [Pleurodeles waltl]
MNPVSRQPLSGTAEHEIGLFRRDLLAEKSKVSRRLVRQKPLLLDPQKNKGSCLGGPSGGGPVSGVQE